MKNLLKLSILSISISADFLLTLISLPSAIKPAPLFSLTDSPIPVRLTLIR